MQSVHKKKEICVVEGCLPLDSRCLCVILWTESQF